MPEMVSVPKVTLNVSFPPEPPLSVSSPALPFKVSSPAPPVKSSSPVPPLIVKPSAWLPKVRVVADDACPSIISILLILELSVSECEPDDNMILSPVPFPPLIVSLLPSPAFKILNVSFPEPPTRVSVPAPLLISKIPVA